MSDFIALSDNPDNWTEEQREHFHHYAVRQYSSVYNGRIEGRESEFRRYLKRGEQLVKSIATNSEAAVVEHQGTGGKSFHRLTKIGRRLWRAVWSYKSEVVSRYAHHRFNPYLQVLLSAMQQWAAELQRDMLDRNGPPMPDLRLPHVRERLEACLAYIHTEARSDKLKAAVKRYRDNENQNIREYTRFLAAWFEACSVLCISRVDLYFRPDAKDWGDTREAHQQLRRLIRALNETRLLPGFLDYIWKREDGVDRGIHYHVLLIQDGHNHDDAHHAAKVVGEHWKKLCGKDENGNERGSYFNVYALKDQRRFNGLGLVCPSDWRKLRGLRYAIEYLCKETSQLKPQPFDPVEGQAGRKPPSGKGVRNICHGNWPKPHSGRGAPRTTNADPIFIQRELLKRRGT